MIKLAVGYQVQEARIAIALDLLRILRKLDSLKVKYREQIIVTSHFQTLVKCVTRPYQIGLKQLTVRSQVR